MFPLAYRYCDRYFYFLIITLFLPSVASAVNVPDAATMLKNISNQAPFLVRLATAVAYVVGMYLIIVGVIKFKHLGESRTMMSSEHSAKEPLIYLTVGALLIYFPSTVWIGLGTFWGEPNPYGYETTGTLTSQAYASAILVIQLFGTIAVIRGLIILSRLAKMHSQGEFGKGLTHVIGGLLCVNIFQLIETINATLGITS
jgi:intracellular multiplication protein IcmC